MPVENAVIDALNAQMGREFEAHLQYLSVSSWFDAEGLPELHQVLRRAGRRGARARDEVPHLRPGRRAARSSIPAPRRAQGRLRERRGGRRRRASSGRSRSPGTSTPSSTWRSATSDHADAGVPAVVRDRAGRGGRHHERAAPGDAARGRGQPAAARGLRRPLGAPRRRPDGGVAGPRPGSRSRPLRGDDYAPRPGRGGRVVRPPGRAWSCTASSSTSSGRRASGSRIARGAPAGFLLGLVSEAEPDLAYVHMHVVDPAWRGAGVGERASTGTSARGRTRAGCRRVRRPRRARPRGLAALPRAARLPRGGSRPGYLGPGADRIVFERLPLEDDAKRRSSATIACGSRYGDDRRSLMAEIDPARRAAGAPARGRRACPRACSSAARWSRPRASTSARAGAPRGRRPRPHRRRVLLAGADFPSAAQVRIEIELAEIGWHSLDAEVVRVNEGGRRPRGGLRRGGDRGRPRGDPGLLPGAPLGLSASAARPRAPGASPPGPRSPTG